MSPQPAIARLYDHTISLIFPGHTRSLRRRSSALVGTLSLPSLPRKFTFRERFAQGCVRHVCGAVPILAEHLMFRLDSPVLLVFGRVAHLLVSRAGLDQYHSGHLSEDPEVDSCGAQGLVEKNEGKGRVGGIPGRRHLSHHSHHERRAITPPPAERRA